jgi:hypothetical protein
MFVKHMAVKTDMLKGKSSVLLIIFGVATIFLTLLFMYMNSGYSNVIDLAAAEPVLIGQLLLLNIINGAIVIALLWYSFFNMAVIFRLRMDVTEMKSTIESIALQLAEDKTEEKK